jgi:hypothetical protein
MPVIVLRAHECKAIETLLNSARDDRKVHIKGFVSGIDAADPGLDVATTLLEQAAMVIFDGDLPSFGSYVNRIDSMAPAGATIVAFRFDSGIRSFVKAYSKRARDIYVVEVDSKLYGSRAWCHLGTHALKATRATKVVAIGGGKTVSAEYDAMSGAQPAIEFAVVDVYRVAKGARERGSLAARAPLPHVAVIAAPAGARVTAVEQQRERVPRV